MPRSSVTTLIHLDHAASMSLRDQVYRRMRELIVAGHIPCGGRLPSSRSLSAQLRVSRNTIVAAFEQLTAEGYLRGKPGSGSFVALELPDHRIEAAGSRSRPPRPSIERQAPIGLARAFALGVPAIDEFPNGVWRALVTKRWRRPGSLGGYGATAGLRSLRQAVADYVAVARGVRCDTDQVFIVGGAQRAFDLAARVLLVPGDAVWVENPGYVAAANAFRAAGATLVPVPVDDHGLDVARGRALNPNPRLMFVTPSHQFPLGVMMTMDRRRELLDAAHAANAWILEDDYDSEFRYSGRPLPSLQGMDENGRVIYVGSFSKGLLPGLRLGYVVVPSELIDQFLAAGAVSSSNPSLGDQAVAADFMLQGHFAKHIRRMRELYLGRRDILRTALNSELGDSMHVPESDAGTHLVVHMPASVSDRELADATRARGVVTLPLSGQYFGGTSASGLLLGYGGVRGTLIPRAVREIAAALAQMTRVSARVRSASSILALALGALVAGGRSVSAQAATPRADLGFGRGLTPGMSLVYESGGTAQSPWQVDTVQFGVEVGGRAGATRIVQRMRADAPPTARAYSVSGDILSVWDVPSSLWRPQRPIAPGKEIEVPQGASDTARVVTAGPVVLQVGDRRFSVLPTVFHTRNRLGRPVRRLTEQYSPELATAIEGIFEVADSVTGAWRVTQRFRLVAIK